MDAAPAAVSGGSVIPGEQAAVSARKQTAAEKRKRGRPPRGEVVARHHPPPAKKMMPEEDVCFICFDGGSLVLCDRKGCPKAYHPTCIKRDESYFAATAKWNCGWHICSVCHKLSHYLCYTCTFSLCKDCITNAEYFSVRGNKGFCTTCMKTIMLIENKDEVIKEKVQVDFDDKTTWEYLFKVYWLDLKGKLSLTLNDLLQAKRPKKETPPAVSSSIRGQAKVRRCRSESSNATPLIDKKLTPDTKSSEETEQLWFYHDPTGKVQGPFSMLQLGAWNKAGFFPPDLKVWKINEDDRSLLLTDALLHKPLEIPGSAVIQSSVFREASDVKSIENKPNKESFSLDGGDECVTMDDSGTHSFLELLKGKISSSEMSQHHPIQLSGHPELESRFGGNECHEMQSTNSQPFPIQSSGQNWESLPVPTSNLVLPATNFASVPTEPDDLPEQSVRISFTALLNESSPTAGGGDNKSWEVQAAEELLSLSSCFPTQRPNHQDHLSPSPSGEDHQYGQTMAETKDHSSSNLPVQDSVRSWSSASSMAINEWESTVVVSNNLPAGTPTSNIENLTNSSPSPLTLNVSSWQPIEFTTLDEESVSDLLAEVDALESQSGLGSPASALRCGKDVVIPKFKNEYFNFFEELNPMPDPVKPGTFNHIHYDR
ncbi:unnamed protein product [Cuscuta campestris]|uniref:GYF domain-containing protein n=1 Tax=Cuscuta campestris TaxID=132261 RepID=A0A484NN00_9ASTE|nr:unnamed protein product [Cuscuta campestris]